MLSSQLSISLRFMVGIFIGGLAVRVGSSKEGLGTFVGDGEETSEREVDAIM